MVGVLHRGWLTKSPPEKKLGSHIKLFCAKWKKRYFVLSVTDTCHDLSYYKDSTCQNKKGSINLSECTDVTRADQMGGFPHLFAVKTMCKNKPRTYYLAAYNSHEVDTWIHWLTIVCGHKDEEDEASKEYLEYNPISLTTSLPFGHSPDENTRISMKEESRFIEPENERFSSIITPECAPMFDFTKYHKEIPTQCNDSPESKESWTLASKDDQKDSWNSTSNSSSNDSTELKDQPQAKASRVVSDYDVPRSTRVKGSSDLPPPASHRPKFIIHTYVNTGPMSHLFNPEIDLQVDQVFHHRIQCVNIKNVGCSFVVICVSILFSC